MKILHYLLMTIRKNPFLILGEKSLSSLGTYLCGAIDAIAVMTGSFADYAPNGFSQFVLAKFPTDECICIYNIILRSSENEAEAFDTFFELLDEFLELNHTTYSLPDDTKDDILGLFQVEKKVTEEELKKILADLF